MKNDSGHSGHSKNPPLNLPRAPFLLSAVLMIGSLILTLKVTRDGKLAIPSKSF